MVRAQLGGGGSESLPVLVRDLAGERERIGNEAAEEGQISQVTVRSEWSTAAAAALATMAPSKLGRGIQLV